MYVREIPAEQYHVFKCNLDANAYRVPMDVTYYCDLKVNDILYRLHLQMGDHRKLVPLQIVRMNRNIQKCELITDSQMLIALTELLVAQYCSSVSSVK